MSKIVRGVEKNQLITNVYLRALDVELKNPALCKADFELQSMHYSAGSPLWSVALFALFSFLSSHNSASAPLTF